MTKSLTAEETYKIVKKMWASTEDIKKLGCIGNNKALKIKREIRNKMVDEGYVIPRNLVDMQLVVDYFKLDLNKIERLVGGVING